MTFRNEERLRRRPDAVLFDTDNTLYAYQPAHEAAMNAVRIKVMKSLSMSADQFNAMFVRARHEVKADLTGKASSHSRLLYFQRMLELVGLRSQVLMALDFEQTYWRTFLSNAKLFDDVKELLDDLRFKGIPTAIVTDLTSQIQFRKIVYFGLDSYFDYIITSEEAGHDKPHRASFDLAIKKMKLSGNCIWMVGDDPVSDLMGARDAVGAIVIQKVHPGVEIGKGEMEPDLIVHHFRELREFVNNLSA